MTRLKATVDGVVPFTQEEELEADAVFDAARGTVRATLAARIDAAVAAIYARPMTFSKEYEQREAQATAFKAAGYAGPVPPRVAGFAEPAGLTAQEATDLILSQAAQLRGALDQLSDLRMKKNIITRCDAAGVYVANDADAQAVFNETMAAIKAVAAALG